MKALITGAPGGLGREFARIFAREKYDLLLTGRNKEALKKISWQISEEFKITVKIFVEDLSEIGAGEKLYQRVKGEGVDVLVNNAGFGNYGFFTKTDLSQEVDEIGVNITSLTVLTKLFLVEMVENKKGKILNVASTAAFFPGPLMAVYYASKAYVLSFSEALQEELRGSGVSISVLCPGPTKTHFQERANMMGVKLFPLHVMDPETVAEAGFRGLMEGKSVVIPGFYNKLLIFISKFVPKSLVLKSVRIVQER